MKMAVYLIGFVICAISMLICWECFKNQKCRLQRRWPWAAGRGGGVGGDAGCESEFPLEAGNEAEQYASYANSEAANTISLASKVSGKKNKKHSISSKKSRVAESSVEGFTLQSFGMDDLSQVWRMGVYDY